MTGTTTEPEDPAAREAALRKALQSVFAGAYCAKQIAATLHDLADWATFIAENLAGGVQEAAEAATDPRDRQAWTNAATEHAARIHDTENGNLRTPNRTSNPAAEER